MNNNFNDPNNQGAQNGAYNNYNGQFNGNMAPQQPPMGQPMPGQQPMIGQTVPGQQPMMAQPVPGQQPMMPQQPTNNIANPQMVNSNYNNVTKKTSSKAPVIIIIAVILLTAIGGLVLVLSRDNGDKNNSKDNNQTNNNAEVNNSTNNDSETNDTTNNNTNTETNDDSDNTTNNNNSGETIPLNSYANIGEQVEMKVNNTYVEDTFNFATSITIKNNGNTDVVLNGTGFETQSFAYYQAHFVPKSIGLANATENDLMLEACFLRKIVRSDGVETTITSGDTENTMLKAGETLNGVVYCSITGIEGNASGVEPVLFYTEHYTGANQKIKTSFDTRNSMK